MSDPKLDPPEFARPPGARGRGAWLLGVGLALAGAAVIRFLALENDFWIDEIWSLHLSTLVRSSMDVLTLDSLEHDNNHPLNTLYLHWLGEREGWIAYRLLSAISGVATVAVAAGIGLRRSRLTGVVTAALFGSSFILTAYSAEARGYAPAVLFALSAYAALESQLERPRPLRVLAFNVFVLLGFLCHFSFAHFYLGALVWSGWWALRGAGRTSGLSSGRRFRMLLSLHAAPLAFAAWLYTTFVSQIQVGGGPAWDLNEVLGRTLAYTVGGPPGPVALVLGTSLVVVVLALQLTRARRAKLGGGTASERDACVLTVTVVLVAPAFTLIALDPPVLVPRYFLFPITFFLLALGKVLARGMAAGGVRSLPAAIVLALYVAGNLTHIVPFLRYGTGGYGAAVQHMAAGTPGPVIAVGSDHDFRNGAVLLYHRRFLEESKNLRYFARNQTPPRGVDWYIRHSKLAEPGFEDSVSMGGRMYVLDAKFEYYGPSGFNWWVYRRRRS